MNELELFVTALRIDDPTQRSAYLDRECNGDDELQQRVESLLAAYENALSYLELSSRGISPTVETNPSGQAGQPIGPYKLLQLVGEGGMGSVWMAEQLTPVRRRVAIKLIKPGMDSRQVLARFDAERQALSMMDHPNIAKVLDAGSSDAGTPYFVMELVKGKPITDYCDQNRLSPRERLELFLPVCHAIQHAHQKGIIHRDIKPSNVLVAEYDGRPIAKVIDFGVAKAVHQPLTEQTMFTGLGQIVGTLEYMSPEQAKVNQLDVDTRSDVYSMGVMLYKLLTGSTPFDRKRLRAAALDELLKIIREEEPLRPSVKLSSSESLPSIAASRKTDAARLSTMIRGELDWIVMKALEKDRNRRYETAKDFANDIESYLKDEQVAACPPTTTYLLRKFARRNKTLMATTGVVAVTMILGLLIASSQAIRATRAERVALSERDEKEIARREALDSAERARAAAASEREAREAESKQREKAEAAEQTAAEKAALASAVMDFLKQDILGLAHAENQMRAGIRPDPDLKLVTLLHRSLATLDDRFADQPQPRAEVQSVLANAFFGIGLYADAIPLAEELLQYHKSFHGPEHPTTLESMGFLAALYQFQGKCGKAESLLEEAWEISRRVVGPEDQLSLELMHELATLYQFCLHRYSDAKRLQSQHLEIAHRVLGPEHYETIFSMGALAGALHGLGKFAEAESLFKQSIEKGSQVFGSEHPNTLAVRNNLACLYRDQGKLSKAELIFSDLLDVERRIRGAEHPDTLRVLRHLAKVYQAQGRFVDAKPLFQFHFDTTRIQLGPGHPSTFESLLPLVQVCIESRKKTKAVELIQGHLEVVRRDTPFGSPQLANALEQSGLLLLHCSCSDDAESLMRECLEIRQQAQPESWATSNAESILGEILTTQATRLLESDNVAADQVFVEAKTLLLRGYEGLKSKETPIGQLNRAFERMLELFVVSGSFDQFEEMKSELSSESVSRAKFYVDACWRKMIRPRPDGKQLTPDALNKALGPALELSNLEVDIEHAAWLAATKRIDEYQAFVTEIWQRQYDLASPRQSYLLARLSLMTPKTPIEAAEVLSVARTACVEPFAWHDFVLGLALLRTQDYDGVIEALPPSSCNDWCGGLNALVRSLALHGLGRDEEAQADFERGRHWVERHPLEAPNNLAPHDRIQGVLLMREAQQQFSP